MDKLALRPLLDFAPRNLEFHNFSSLKLTAPQSKALGLGLKFRPTLKPPSVAQFLPQIQDFCRSVRLHKNSNTSQTIRTSTQGCTSSQSGTLLVKTRIWKITCITFDRNFAKTSVPQNLSGTPT